MARFRGIFCQSWNSEKKIKLHKVKLLKYKNFDLKFLWNWSYYEVLKKSSVTWSWKDNGVTSRTTDTQWRHKSKISEKMGRCGRQNMLPRYLKIWEWAWIFGRAVKAIASLGVRSPWLKSCLFFRAEVDLTQNLFYEKVLFCTQLTVHLMRKLLKKS